MSCQTLQLTRRYMLGAVAVGSAVLFIADHSVLAQTAPLTRAQKEEFLLKAKIVETRISPLGITRTLRATLDDGKLTYDASIQVVDEEATWFEDPPGVQVHFKDSWKFNVAAYKLDQLLGLNMIPVTVERAYSDSPGSFTWWVNDVAMHEGEMIEKKIEAPDTENWNAQRQIVRVFDELIFNDDRTPQNLLIDKNWQIWMIDHSRAFRTPTSLREPKSLERCDQGLLDKLKQLDAATLKKELGRYLAEPEIRGLLARRDGIVKIYEEKGPSVLYKLPRRPD